ncbi:glycosyl transferase [Litorivicinus sp.]|jgi:glucosyl-3-phosphoglycerate synthase|nr:glycosyl transferase [Litorivicinus sp.]|tara:strand:- start:5188 stop:6408 length:1221 start_codon:yes stop_codon:yes gene_type:complete
MGDFYQNGIVTTLHNLSQRSTDSVESELLEFSEDRRLGLILPCLYSELETTAMPKILEQLCRVSYLNQLIIGLDCATQEEYTKALGIFSQLPQNIKVLWNDGPRLKALDQKLRSAKLSPDQMGKGRNVWFCMGYALGSNQADAVAIHDCDITTYDRSLLARLLYPVAHPQFNYEFCKGYYARVADGKINGRVSRLLVTPLLKTLKRIFGSLEYLDYLDSFRYPLAGEMSFRRDVMKDLRIPSDWGLEIGILSEMTRNHSNNRICQVDIADTYDHKHQDLSLHDESAGLSRMSIDISKAIFRKLATNGIVFSQETFRTIKATYYRVALDFVDIYKTDAEINGLKLDLHSEEKAVELFALNVMKAGNYFLENPTERPFIPSWNRVNSALPSLVGELLVSVEADMNEFC